MPIDLSRRDLCGLLASVGVLRPGATLGQAALPDGLDFGAPQFFSFDLLRERARAMAARPYVEAPLRAGDVLERIDYVEHMQINYDLRRDLPVGLNALVQPFHLGRFFKLPVRLNLVTDGAAHELLYSRDSFEFPEDNPASDLPDDIGYAGFRVLTGMRNEWCAFLGASYFRSAGPLQQYGQSARAVAIDVAMPTPEEFPRFTDFWFEAREGNGLIIYALLDGPRITGALRIDASNDGPVLMEVDVHFVARSDIGRVGIAPLTSMYWYSETDRRRAFDWRPEVHDTDGLGIWTGADERLWRPLNNPTRVVTSSFIDPSVRGFGLLQRDRNFFNYEDSYAAYDRRPSVWIEPLGDWGPGAVQLVEIPTTDEINDNVVAYWLSDGPVLAGAELSYAYRIHWVAGEPFPDPRAHVSANRLGQGGPAGQPPLRGVTRIAVDFAGGAIALLDDTYVMNSPSTVVTPVVWLSSGHVSLPHAFAVGKTRHWRAVFDFTPEGPEPVEMRLHLERDGEVLSETWTYQFHPTELPDPVRVETTAAPGATGPLPIH